MALPPPSPFRSAIEVTNTQYLGSSVPAFVPSWEAIPESIETVYAQSLINVRLCLNVFKDLGIPITPAQTILDFGCGEGRMVYQFRKLGYHAFGMDIVHPISDAHLRMTRERLRKPREEVIAVDATGRIPFPDNHFDVVVSWEVMEHVQNHDVALSEIHRVLKPGGRSLHYFPARYRILEPHISVPFASIIQNYRYLLFWAEMGIRTRSQLSMTAEQTAQENFEYLRSSTNYLKKKELIDLVESYFGNIRFVEENLWKFNDGKTGFIHRALSYLGLSRLIPVATYLLSPFARWAVFFEKLQ